MFNVNELSVLRGSLDAITIKGSDAKQIAALQDKVEMHINNLKAGPSVNKSSKK
jgi:hypothetical protein